MTEYRVIWRIDLVAESAREAAKLARKIQLDPDSIATVFEVESQDDVVIVDADVTEEEEGS